MRSSLSLSSLLPLTLALRDVRVPFRRNPLELGVVELADVEVTTDVMGGNDELSWAGIADGGDVDVGAVSWSPTVYV